MARGVYKRTEKHKKHLVELMKRIGQRLPKKLNCKRCKRELKKEEIKSPRQKYCKGCHKIIRRKQTKLINRKYKKTEKGIKQTRKDKLKRRAMENNIIEDFSNEEWLAKLVKTEGICPKCKTYVGIAHLTLDHIYPVSMAKKDFEITGIKRIYFIEDVQPLCMICNCKKGCSYNA